MERLRNFYKDKRVLITGNTGFKGSWLCQILLNFGANVCGIGLKPNTNPNLFSLLELQNRINSNFIDIRDYEKVKNVFESFKPEIVIHLAAQPLVIDSYINPRYTYDVNVMGTVNVCDCVKNLDCVKSFVNVTTDKVYENVEDVNHYYVEDDKLNGYDPYSNSKSCSELVTQSYMKSFMKDRAVSTCRAGNVIGGGDFSANRIMVDSYLAAKEHKSIKVRNPNSIRPYQHVLEADMFYLLLAMKQYEDISYSGHYNIGPRNEDCVSTGEIVEKFCKYWGDTKYEVIDFNGPHEANFLKLDASKARQKLNWNPKWRIDTAIEKTVELYKAILENSDIILVLNKQIEEYLKEGMCND